MRTTGHALVPPTTGLLAHALSPATLSINSSSVGAPVSPRLFGLFFEEINHAGDGGLYAELIRNRNFDALDQTSSVRLRRASLQHTRLRCNARTPTPRYCTPAD